MSFASALLLFNTEGATDASDKLNVYDPAAFGCLRLYSTFQFPGDDPFLVPSLCAGLRKHVYSETFGKSTDDHDAGNGADR